MTELYAGFRKGLAPDRSRRVAEMTCPVLSRTPQGQASAPTCAKAGSHVMRRLACRAQPPRGRAPEKQTLSAS